MDTAINMLMLGGAVFDVIGVLTYLRFRRGEALLLIGLALILAGIVLSIIF